MMVTIFIFNGSNTLVMFPQCFWSDWVSSSIEVGGSFVTVMAVPVSLSHRLSGVGKQKYMHIFILLQPL
jgi:hypothetical protein